MTKIFESPDKGKTSYAREFGESERTLYTENVAPVKDTQKQVEQEDKKDGND
jgi:hypothetical protein